jgi:hypothetical protein
MSWSSDSEAARCFKVTVVGVVDAFFAIMALLWKRVVPQAWKLRGVLKADSRRRLA